MTWTPTLRDLNRTLLARQWLLERVDATATATIEHLIGLQGQNPLDAYYSLWSRLRGFQPEALAELLERRDCVRLSFLRATIHLTTTDDALRVRPALQDVHERVLFSGSPFGRHVRDFALDDLLAAGAEWTTARPRSIADLRRLVAPRWPDRDDHALAQVIRYLLPLVQVTPRGVWGKSKRAEWTPIEHWVGQSLGPVAAKQDVILRYLYAFGPSSVADIATWSGWTGVADLVEPIRHQLVSVEHPDTGRELLDLPDGRRVGADTHAPVRFLPEYDNVLLGHKDRARIVGGPFPEGLIPVDTGVRFLLVDGFIGGHWTVEADRSDAELTLVPLTDWTRAQRRDVLDEGRRLLTFAAPDLAHEIVVAG